MQTLKKILTSCFLMFFALNLANADCGKGMNGKMPAFSDFDLNGDGKIVEQEFNEGHAGRMQEMAAEGRSMKHAGDAPGFAGIDSNSDGEISADEFAAHQAEHHGNRHCGDDRGDKQ